jgi:phosphate-selective porin OprO/OprP
MIMNLKTGVLFLFFYIVVSYPLTYSQKQRDVDISNLPYYNFGKGVGLTSPDSLFQFNIRFRMQNRFSFIQNDGKEAAIDGQIRRLRLRFDGFVGSPAFLYVLQLSFAPGDVGEIEAGENLNIIRDAVVYYRASPKWNFGFGQTKLPGNRQRVNSSGALQLSDRTISNSRFNIDRDFGFFINMINEYQDQFSWNIKSALTTGDGRNFTKSPDNGLAYTGKVELLPFGRFTKDGVFFEGDIIREKKPKLMLSAAYHFNHKAKRQAGVLGDDLFQPRDLKSLLVDAIFKYKGFAVMSSYMSRDVTDPILRDITGTTYIYKGHGIDFQSSYFITKNWEIIGRMSKVTPSTEIKSAFPVHQQYTLGFTKYIWEHAFKIQLEANLDRLSHHNGETKNNIYTRLQIEMGI